MTYSYDFKLKIFNLIKSKKFNNIEIMNIFKISRRTFYKIKNDHKLRGGSKYSYLEKNKRDTKITETIRKFITNYVIKHINFDHKELMLVINKKFNVLVSKTSIYRILKEENISKKKHTLNKY